MLKFYFALLLALVFSGELLAQSNTDNIYTKDGSYLGSRKELVEACANAMNVNSSRNSKETVCSCILNAVAKEFTLKQMAKINSKEGFDYTQFLTDKKRPVLRDDLSECVSEFSKTIKQEEGKEDYVRENYVIACVKTASASMDADIYDIDKYCNCTYDKILESKINMNEVAEMIEDTESILYTHVIMKCIDESKK